ncbi:fibronectin type III domain-containing protein [Candidatus Poriferisodalis sp.]|uniref:fibronectin type III domain-containing protein n=1 Tax=Candidatus Poriferisodalis sp. TaxID=3101277 RepID=UPI003B5B62D3
MFAAVVAVVVAAASALPAQASDGSVPAGPSVPAPPTGLSADASRDVVSLSWDDPGDDSITGYVILRRDKATQPVGTFSTVVADTGTADTSYVDAYVEPNRRYVYRVQAINAAGTSERSRWARGYTPLRLFSSERPAKPRGLAAETSHDTVTLSWDDPGDGSVTGYAILRRDKDVHDKGIFATLDPDTGTAHTAYVDATAQPDRRYVYRVKALNTAGHSKSAWTRGWTPTAPPADTTADTDPAADTEQPADEPPGEDADTGTETAADDGDSADDGDPADDDSTGDGPADDVDPADVDPAGGDAAGDDLPASELAAVWSATMTAERALWGYGYYSSNGTVHAGSLDPASFEMDGTTYTVTMIESSGWMYIVTDRELPFGFVLELDGAGFASVDASSSQYSYGNVYRWRGTDLAWGSSDTVEIRLLRTAEEIPVNSPATGAPTISGTAQVGRTLTADTSAIVDPDGLHNASFAYQWMGWSREIDGADGASFTLTPDERGRVIAVRVTFTDDAGNGESLTSELTAPVVAAPNSAATGAPFISGRVRVNQVLRAHTSGIVDPDGIAGASFAYQWMAGGRAIDGADGASFTLTPDERGQAIAVRVTFIDNAGYPESRTSSSTMTVQPASECPGAGSGPTPTLIEVEAVPVVVESTTEKYYVLYVRHQLDADTAVEIPVSVALGEAGTTTLTERLSALPPAHYRVDEFLIADPGDVDGDCIDDITELGDPAGMNPLNPAPEVEPVDGAVAVPDRETFEALSYQGPDVWVDTHLSDLEFVKFYLFDMDTDRPVVYFMNTETHRAHRDFGNVIGLWTKPHWRWSAMRGEIVYHPNVVARDGSLGVYRFEFEPQDAYSFEAVAYAYEVMAASIPLLEGNFAYYPMPARALPLYHEERALYDGSRVDVLLEEDVFPDVDFLALNRAEGYGFLRVMSLEERPDPRDVVIYETLPNELSRVAGIITSVPQTPLSHVNLRAVQDSVPNAFIRDALDDEAIDDLIDSFVHYSVDADGWTLRAATPAEVDAHYAASRPAQAQTPQRDLAVTQITALGDIEFGDWTAFGVKAANVAVLGTLGFPEGTVPEGFAVPFSFYDGFMTHNGFYDDIAAMLADPAFQSDFDTQASELKALRKKIKKGETPGWIIDALTAMHGTYPEGQSLRYRSSTNNEDLPGFSGAGLYDSKTQDPDETAEDGIDKSIKGVWASMWNFGAFTEREFHRVDHLAAAMGVLVHPNYSDELANGVAVSFDPYGRSAGSYYINTQLGEDLVTNPDAHSVPEEMLLHPDGTYTVLARSNQIPAGELLMSDAQIEQLRLALGTIHDRFAVLYGIEPGEQFAIEIEYKITSDNTLAIKQARPWIFNTP